MTELSTDADFSIDEAMPAGFDQQTDAAQSQAAEAAPEKQSIDDAINAAFAKHAPQPDAPTGQPRDEAGRFAAKAAEEAAAKVAASQQPPPPAATGAQMPASWGKDKAALWASASPDLQAQIAAREAQVATGFQRYEGLSAFADLAERNGASLRQVFERAKAWEDGMASDPVGTLRYAMQAYNVNPATVMAALSGQQQPAAPQPSQQPQLPPEVVQELNALKSSVHELRTAPIQQQVEAFFADPANKYASQLADTIASILKIERGLSLKDAYDRACWSDPQVRDAMLKEQQAKQVADATKTARTSTQTALRASKSLAGSPPPPVNGVQRRSMSIDDAINAAYADHGLSR